MTRPQLPVLAAALLAGVLFLAPLRAQTAPAATTLTIRMFDARSGRQITPDNFVIRFDHQDDIHNETLKIDDEGTGRITLPAGASFLAVQGTFDNSMQIYINCDTGKEKDQSKLHWYDIPTISSTGVIAPNECFNGKFERPRIPLKPGEFDFYVRQRNWRDPGSY
jgi:hypothetical protein